MSNLARIPPRQKTPKLTPQEKADGKIHMSIVANSPCMICQLTGQTQNSRTEVHHCKSGRFSNLREIDANTIPLCHSHHNKLKPIPGDEDKIGFHNAQETWEGLYGRDYDLLEQFNREIEDRLLGEHF